MRSLYACILGLHPPAFRTRFAAEMLCIFEEAAPAIGASRLIFDGLVSLARQWLLRSGSWLLALAILGACLQVTAGGLIFLAHGVGHLSHATRPLPQTAALEWLMRFILASVGGIAVLVVAASFWMRSFVRSRSPHPR